ncbi:MAG TPA: hypothetical protein DEO67_01620 [Candidatus Edwardsbacteria bacterium]|nr:hypothetical protein [Candidatus Edwardsbacteria bacterium]
MVRGYIYGDRYKLKWLPEEKSLLLGLWAIGSSKLGEFAGFGRPKVGANMCQACRKFIIDM